MLPLMKTYLSTLIRTELFVSGVPLWVLGGGGALLYCVYVGYVMYHMQFENKILLLPLNKGQNL